MQQLRTFHLLGNKQGDVYYVESESAGYVWINDNGTLRWELLGMTVDTSNFLTKTGLLQTTGNATNNTMSQNAITQELGNKQDTLVSGTNIKTINNESILGSGNIEIQGGGGFGTITRLLNVTSLTANSEYNLSDNITNYKYLMFLLSTNTHDENGTRQYVPVEQISGYSNLYRVALSLYQASNVFVFADFYFTSATKLKCNTLVKGTVGWNGYIKIYGIK